MIEENQYNEDTVNVDYSPQQIRQQLLGAFQVLSDSAPSAELLQKSHQVISGMMKCELFFDTALLLLEEFQYSKEYCNMSKLIITTLSTFIKHQQASSRLAKKVDRHTLNNKLIAFFTQPSIHEDYRLLLVKSYTQFIFSPGMETIRGQTVEMLCNQFGMLAVVIKNYLSIGKNIPDGQVFYAMSYIFIARALTKGPIEQTMMKSIVKVFLPVIQTLCIYFLSLFAKAIYEKDEALFMQTSGICSKLIEFFKELVVGTSKQNLSLLKTSIMKDPQVKEIIQTALFLTIDKCSYPQAKQIVQLVIEANGNKYIQRINEIKQNCVAIINHYAKLCVTVQPSSRQLEKEEYKVPLEICKYFLYNAPQFIIQEFTALNYPSKPLPHPGLFKIMTVALSNIIRLHQFFDESFKIRNRLFFHVCLPLMQRNVNEHYHNAQDFKGKRQDILNAHCSDIPENAACKLIQAYIDRIDGSVMVYSNALCQTIEFHLTANPNIFSKLPLQLTESSYFKETDYLIQIQACLSVLSVFSYMSIGRQELVMMMEELFVSRKKFLLNPSNNGMLKSAALLAYTYYVDNFYTNLREQNSNHRELHLEILEYCCRNIEEYTQGGRTHEDRNASLSLEIGALQSIDCISNCISQKHFLAALFWDNEGVNEKVNDSHFYNLFIFLVKQLWGKFNVHIIDVLIQFITESIKSQCNYGHAIKRDHYQYKEVPMVIRGDVCSLIIQDIYKVYNTNSIPNHSLMKCKITRLLEIILTCCEFPDQVLNNEFFSLKVEDDDVWEIAGPIDIFLRRMIVFKQEGREVNEQAMGLITISAINLMQIALKDQKMDKLFGIIVNIIVLRSDGIDDLAICLSNSLVNLLKAQDESNNYQQDLESMIEKLAYLNLIAINDRFSPRTQETWCFLTERIQQFLENRSSKGIIAAKSIPYVGKLLTISLVCIYNMQKIFNVGETQKTVHLLNNILRTADVYVTTAERQIVASIFMKLIDSKAKVEDMDDSHKKCFALVSHVLYKAYSKAFKVNKENYDDNADGSNSSGCDLSEDEEKEDIPNYKEYKITSNQYAKRQKKQQYILLFKDLCHKLKSTSPQFLKSAVEALPLPIQNFVKTQVFYYESQGSESSQSMRKVIKVKKESPINE